jgi:hypothetical protein
MKPLPTQVILKSDNCQLVQVKRTEKAALYARSTLAGKPVGYEVLLINSEYNAKTRQWEEVYPKSTDFGFEAWFCITLDQAEQKFDEIVKDGFFVVTDEHLTVRDVKG